MLSHISSTEAILWVEKMIVCPFLFQFQDFLFQSFRIHGSKPLNGSSKISSDGFVDDGNDELHFCCIPFDNSSSFLFHQGMMSNFSNQRVRRVRASIRQPFQLGEVDGLFAYFHLFIQSPFFREITDLVNILRSRFASVETDGAAVGGR